MTYMGGSVTSLVTDRNTWNTRADQAWGPSRDWSVGDSFETDLAEMTTDRNNWQNSSNTWQGRADQAWGPSDVWSSGESWEAAYTRVLPVPAAGRAWTCNLNNEGDHGSNEDVKAVPLSGQTTLPLTGYYTLTVTWSNTSGNTNSRLDVRLGGSGGTLIMQATGAGNYRHAFYVSGVLTAGTALWAGTYYSTQGFGHLTGGAIGINFQSTREYPH